VAWAVVQLSPNMACGFSEPETWRQDEETVQVPTALPPQAVTLAQDALEAAEVL
jgi:hypothetical protein